MGRCQTCSGTTFGGDPISWSALTPSTAGLAMRQQNVLSDTLQIGN